MKRLLLIVLSFIAYTCIYAQEKHMKDTTDTQILSKKVVKQFEQDNIVRAIEELAVYWPMPRTEIDALQEKTVKYMSILHSRFGETIGTLKVSTKKIGDIAIRETYLVLFENSAIRLIFTYYKNDNGWVVNAFKWDDSFELEFE